MLPSGEEYIATACHEFRNAANRFTGLVCNQSFSDEKVSTDYVGNYCIIAIKSGFGTQLADERYSLSSPDEVLPR